jgi:AcrR family transcriptional regulator
MKTSGRPRSTRDRPAKAPLSEEAIVDAALAILTAEGLQAVSMRRVAASLDTGAGSLYVYVEGRDGLLEAMFNRIIAAVRLEAPDPSRWRAQLHNLLERVRAQLVTHPGMAAATMVDPPRTEAAMRLLENLLGILLAGGLGAQDAAWAADILTAQVTYAAIEAELRRTDPSALAAEITASFARLPAGDFPLITAHAAQLVAGDAGERFRFAMDVVIDGVLGRASRR